MKLGNFILLLSVLAFVATSLTGAEANRIRGHQRIGRVKEDGNDDDATEDVATTSQEAEEEEAQKDDADLKAAAESEDPKEQEKAQTASKALLHKKTPHLAQLAKEVFDDVPVDKVNARMAAKEMRMGGPKPIWAKKLGKRYWRYGMCSSSTFWGLLVSAPMDGARQPLSHINKMKVDGQEVRTVDTVFGVLNSDFFSVFGSLEEAQGCEKPMIIHSIKNMIEVRSASEYFMTAQKAGIPGSGGGVPPAKGMEYCFRVVSKISKSSKAETNQPKVDVYCTELHSDRVQWVESTRKQMELKQIASLDGREKANRWRSKCRQRRCSHPRQNQYAARAMEAHA